VAWLRDKRLLLVLDNFEHLLDAAALVAELLASAPGLATSREALNIYGEQRFPMPPLALPPRDLHPSDAGGAPVIAAEQPAAIALFVQRLQAVRPSLCSPRQTGRLSRNSAPGSMGCRWRSSSPPRAASASRHSACSSNSSVGPAASNY